MYTATASIVVFKTAKIASMFVTFDYVFKTLHELLHDADITHYAELKNCWKTLTLKDSPIITGVINQIRLTFARQFALWL